MHRHQWIIFLPNFILYRDFTSRYISYRIVYSVLVGAGHIYMCVCVYMYIYMYVCICMRIYLCACGYVYIYACECMLLCIHDYMYVFYVCSFYVYWFYDVFYLWLLGQRWPNKEVQTIEYFIVNNIIIYLIEHHRSFMNFQYSRENSHTQRLVYYMSYWSNDYFIRNSF